METIPFLQSIISFSYLGVFVLAFISNIIIPVPEEITLLGIGYLTSTGILTWYFTLPAVILGLFLNDSLIYLLARSNNKWLQKFYTKFFAESVIKHRSMLTGHIGKIIFFSRFLMQLRFVGPYLAGSTRLPYGRFALYNGSAIVIYSSLIIWLGRLLEGKFDKISAGIGQVQTVILSIVVIYLAYSLVKAIMRMSFWHILNK